MIEGFKLVKQKYDTTIVPEISVNSSSVTRVNNYKLLNQTFTIRLTEFTPRIPPPRLVCGTRLVTGARLLSEVLRYILPCKIRKSSFSSLQRDDDVRNVKTTTILRRFPEHEVDFVFSTCTCTKRSSPSLPKWTRKTIERTLPSQSDRDSASRLPCTRPIRSSTPWWCRWPSLNLAARSWFLWNPV